MKQGKLKLFCPPLSGILCLTILVLTYSISEGQAGDWLVGPDFELKKPSDAIRRAKNGDTIKIMAGVYENDYATIQQDDLIIKGIEGVAHLKSSANIPNNKAIWIISGKNITIKNIEFSGARVPDKNGAGIRLDGGSLTLDHCRFHDNEMGILTANNPEISLFISNSEFSHNVQDYPNTGKLSHNIYVGNIATFVMEDSISRGAEYGHLVKSRAQNTIIRNNKIIDEGEISSSYLIDIPNGGWTLIENNYLMKNKGTQNKALISYGTEGLAYKDNALTIKANSAVNEEGEAVLLYNRSNISANIRDNKLTAISSDQDDDMSQTGLWNSIKQKIQNFLNN